MLPTRRSSRLKKGSSSSSRPLISPTFPGSSGAPAELQAPSGMSFNQSGGSWTPFALKGASGTPNLQLHDLPSPSDTLPVAVGLKKDWTEEITSGGGWIGMQGIGREVGGGGAWGGNSSTLSLDGVVGEGAGALPNQSQENDRFHLSPTHSTSGSTIDPSDPAVSNPPLTPFPLLPPSPALGDSSIGSNSSPFFPHAHNPQLGNDGVRSYGTRDENEGKVAAEEEEEEEEERFVVEMVDREFEEEDDMVTGAGEYAMEAGSVDERESLGESEQYKDPILDKIFKSLTKYYEGDSRLAQRMIEGVKSGVSRLGSEGRKITLSKLNREIARISRVLPLHLDQDYLVEWRRSSSRAFTNGIPVMVPHPTDPSTKLVHASNWKPAPLDRNQTALSERDWIASGIWQDEVTHFDESPFMYDKAYSAKQPHRNSLTAEGRRLLDKLLLAKLSVPILDQTLIEVSGSDILEDIFENEGLVLQAIEVTSEWDALKPREKEKENESTYDLRLYHIRLKDQPKEDGTLMDLNVAAIQSLSPSSLTFDPNYFERVYGDYSHPVSKGAVDGGAIARTLKLQFKLGRVLSVDEIRTLDPAAARVAERYERLAQSLLNNKIRELSTSPDPLQRSIWFAIQRLMVERGKETKAMFKDWESRLETLTKEQLKRLNERNIFNKDNRDWYQIQKETNSLWYQRQLEQQHDWYWNGGGREKKRVAFAAAAKKARDEKLHECKRCGWPFGTEHELVQHQNKRQRPCKPGDWEKEVMKEKEREEFRNEYRRLHPQPTLPVPPPSSVAQSRAPPLLTSSASAYPHPHSPPVASTSLTSLTPFPALPLPPLPSLPPPLPSAPAPTQSRPQSKASTSLPPHQASGALARSIEFQFADPRPPSTSFSASTSASGSATAVGRRNTPRARRSNVSSNGGGGEEYGEFHVKAESEGWGGGNNSGGEYRDGDLYEDGGDLIDTGKGKGKKKTTKGGGGAAAKGKGKATKRTSTAAEGAPPAKKPRTTTNGRATAAPEKPRRQAFLPPTSSNRTSLILFDSKTKVSRCGFVVDTVTGRICSETASHLGNLKQHLAVMHHVTMYGEAAPSWECRPCGKIGWKKSHLDTHEKSASHKRKIEALSQP
ncbi:uncharacterized protein JCM6883_004791 [Sporobolomyces salmoneus]|uniref:uncharacterized protein n=1 Tax=Sporobolomyces salmoneus TaxID=183962 RepID=UPI0031760114